MDETPETSQEKLDQMLRDGKISEEEYQQLSDALCSSKPNAEVSTPPPSPRRLRKIWSRRKLRGICAGLAEYFNIDTAIIRVLFVIALIFVTPIALLIYVVLDLTLPWDDPQAALEPVRGGHPWAFAASIFFFMAVVPFMFRVFVFKRFMEIYSQLPASLPPPIFTLIHLSDAYSQLGWVVSAIITALLTSIYILIKNRTMKFYYAITCIMASALLPFLFVAFHYLALFALPNFIPAQPRQNSQHHILQLPIESAFFEEIEVRGEVTDGR